MQRIRQRRERDLATITAILKYILILVVVLALIYGGLRAFFFLFPVFIGLVLARSAMAAADFVLNRVRQVRKAKPSGDTPMTGGKAKKRLSVVFYLLLFLVLLFVIYLLISTAIGFLNQIAEQLPDVVNDANLIDKITDWAEDMASRTGGLISERTISSLQRTLHNVQTSAVERLPDLLGTIVGVITGFFARIPVTLLIVLVTIMSGFYFITQTGKVYGFALKIIPDRDFVRSTFEVASSITHSVFRMFGGYIILMVIEFAQAAIGFLIIGIPGAVTWAVVVAVVDLMPVLGSAAVMLPMAVYYFVSGSAFMGVGLLVLFVIMTVVRNLIEPPIIGNAMQLHPVITILAMILGYSIMGIGGIIIAPMVLVIAREIYLKFNLESTLRRAVGEVLSSNGDDADAPPEPVIETAMPPLNRS